MVGIWFSHNNIFLIVAGVAMLIFFGIPLVLVPVSWAKVFRWEIPQPRNLVVFLGRSVGIFITVLGIFAFKVTQIPSAKPFFFNLMLWIFGGMILLHVYGAIRKTQPITETLEILLWVALSGITICFYPV
jgi:hypothetical protein